MVLEIEWSRKLGLEGFVIFYFLIVLYVLYDLYDICVVCFVWDVIIVLYVLIGMLYCNCVVVGGFCLMIFLIYVYGNDFF